MNAARRPAHVQRATEHRAASTGASCATSSRACSSWTMPRRTAPARSPDALASRVSGADRGDASDGPARPRARRTSTGCEHALRADADADLSDGRRPLARSRVSARSRGRRCERYDLVIGSRYLHGVSVVNWPLHRSVLSAFANRYIRLITGLSPTTARAASASGAATRWRGCRSTRARQRLRIPDRDALRGRASGLPDRRSADHLRRAAEGLLESVDGRADRVAVDALAAHPARRTRAGWRRRRTR